MNSETIYDTEKSKANGGTTIWDQDALSTADGSFASDAAAEDVCYKKGVTILDTYRVENDAIESGGMGRVWRVHHTLWNVDLAMKRPRAEYFSGEESKQNFIRECDTLSSGAVVCITPADRARHSLHIQPNFDGYPVALIWARGVFRFQTDAEYECFAALEGDQFKILDVDEKRGLILYSCTNPSTMDCTFYIWDVLQHKH